MPHDKVYSLLGVVNDAASVMGVSPCTFEVDYGASPADVLKAATTKIVNDNDHLGFISVAGLTNYGRGTDISPSFHQPSWVPHLSDFANCARTLPILSIRGGYKARWDPFRYGELGSLGFRILGTHLHVKAHRVRRLLDGSYPAWDLGYHHKIEPFAALLLRCGRRYKPTGELSIEAFWRTLIFNTDAHNSPTASSELSSYFKAWLAALIFRNLDVWHLLSPENLSVFQQMTDYQSLAERDGISARSMLPSNEWMTRRLQKLQPSDGPNQQLSVGYLDIFLGRFIDMLSDRLLTPESEMGIEMASIMSQAYHYEKLFNMYSRERRVFLTDGGHLGMAVLSATEGDSVWVVSSCPVPLVLRRVNGSYQLMGDCYVHGIMNGEAVKDNHWEDITIA